MEFTCLNINEAVNFAFKRLISSSTWTYTQIFALSAILAQCEIDYSCYRRWVGLMLVFMSLFIMECVLISALRSTARINSRQKKKSRDKCCWRLD